MRVGPNPRSSRAMLSIRTGWPDRRGDGELAHHVDVAALALQHANRDRVLLAGFAIRRDLVVAGHHQPERVADRRHAHAQVGRARPIHGHLHLGAGIAVIGLRVDEARGLLGLLDDPLRVVVERAEIGAEQRRLEPEVAAAAERIPAHDAGGERRMARQDTANLRHDLGLRDLPLVRGLQVEEQVEVRVAIGAGDVGQL